MRRFCYSILLICLIPLSGWATPVNVYFDPSSEVVNVGDEFTLKLMADIADPVLGWGLTITYDRAILELGTPQIAEPWVPGVTNYKEGDQLEEALLLTSLYFANDKSGFSGTETLLATLPFKVKSTGSSLVEAIAIPENLIQGFALLEPNGFSGFSSTPATINPVPEPSSVLLLASGLTALVAGRRRLFRAGARER